MSLAVQWLLPPAAHADDVADYKKAVEARFEAWLQGLWPDAEAAGVSRKTFDTQLKGMKLDWSLPQLVPPDPAGPDGPPLPASLKPKPRHQAEFDIPEKYFSDKSLNALANGGRAKYQQLGPTLVGDPKAIWRAGEHHRGHLGPRDRVWPSRAPL